MAIRQWLHAAAAASLAIGAAKAQVFDLEGLQFPPPGQAVAAFVTTAAGRGEHVVIEDVLVRAQEDGLEDGLPSGLFIAVLPTSGPWRDLLECASGRGSLAGNVTTIGAVIAPLGVGMVGMIETQLAAAGVWAVVVANCGESEDPYISGGTASVSGTRGFLPAHEEGTENVQTGFGVAYTALALLWVCFTVRQAGGGWTETPLAHRAVSALAFVCLASTLATVGATAAKQRIGSVSLDVGSIAQSIRVAQVVFTFMGVAAGAACSGVHFGGAAGGPSAFAVEAALTIFSVSLMSAFGVLGRKTAGMSNQGWTSATFLPAASVFAFCAIWVFGHMGRRMRELREVVAAREAGDAAASLLRLQVSLGLFLFVAPVSAAAMFHAMTSSKVSYRDVVLAEQAGTVAVLVALMVIWAREVPEYQTEKGEYASQSVPCFVDVETPMETEQVGGEDTPPCSGPLAETVGSPGHVANL